MTAPWDVAPRPVTGDLSAEPIYAAKGRAVSEWEEVEVALSGLYAVFCGFPRVSIQAYRQYGEPLNFRDRLDGLESSAFKYFTKNCDQSYEGEFAILAKRSRGFSIRRNEITHSWVQPLPYERRHERLPDGSDKWVTIYSFFLVPPNYTSRKFDTNNQPEFIYTSVEILRYAQHFSALKWDIENFTLNLENPAWRSFL
jgi:hypothetical protein